MTVKLDKYLTAYNKVADAVISGQLDDETKKKALAVIANTGSLRLRNMNAFVLNYRRSCVLTEAEKAALREGCTDRLRPQPVKKHRADIFSVLPYLIRIRKDLE